MSVKSISEQMSEELQRSPSHAPVGADRLAMSLRIRAERLLLLLLYHPESSLWIHRLPDGAIVIRPGKLAELLRWKAHDVYTNLDYLKSSGHIRKFERHVGKGLCLVELAPPIGFIHDRV